jgi:hypothetical protein
VEALWGYITSIFDDESGNSTDSNATASESSTQHSAAQLAKEPELQVSLHAQEI